MWISIFTLSEKKGQIASMSMVERSGSSFDFFTAQTSKILLGRQGFPSLTRWRISLNIARKGESPIPPATNMRFSYLGEQNSQITSLVEPENEISLFSMYPVTD